MSMEKDSTWTLNSLKKGTKETLVLPGWPMFAGLFKETPTKTFVESEDDLYIFKHVVSDFDLIFEENH